MRVVLVLVVALAVLAVAKPGSSSSSSSHGRAGFHLKKNTSPAVKQPFHFTVVAGNNEPILNSEAYPDEDSARKGIVSVLANGGHLRNYKYEKSADGKEYFKLQADNNKVIGFSETYNSKAAAENGVKAVQKVVTKVTDDIGAKTPVTHGQSSGSPIVSKSGSSGLSKLARFMESPEAGHFEIKSGATGKFHYVIKGANGEIVASSEVYSSLDAAKKGVGAALRACASKQNLFINPEKAGAKPDSKKGFFVNCKGDNNQPLFTTEIYTRAATGEAAIEILQKAVKAALTSHVKGIKTQDFTGSSSSESTKAGESTKAAKHRSLQPAHHSSKKK